MSITSRNDLLGLTRIGRIVSFALAEVCRWVVAGVTTRDLDTAADRVLRRRRARPTPRHEYGFPGAACISINDEAVHGVPSDRVIRPGDVVKVDITADCGGYVADAARTVVVPGGDDALGERLAGCARSAFAAALGVAVAGNRVRDIGRAVEPEVRGQGFFVIRELCGHGVGRSVHEPPDVPNYDDPRCNEVLEPGLVITIEPIIAAGRGRLAESPDGWTLRTVDGSLTAHHEETIVITEGPPLVLTAG